MSNMSYCRFQNTERDLADCVEAMELGHWPQNQAEQAAMFRMVRLCEQFLTAYNYGPSDEQEDDDE